MQAEEVKVYMDNKYIVERVHHKEKDTEFAREDMTHLYNMIQKIQETIGNFRKWDIHHISKNKNSLIYYLAHQAMTKSNNL